MPGCNPYLRDPVTNKFWILGIDDGGLFTLTSSTIPLSHYTGPILSKGSDSYQLGVDSQSGGAEMIIATKITPPTIQTPQPYIPLISSPSGFPFMLVLADPDPFLQSSTTPTILPDAIPYIPDVSMSKWPDSIGVFCASCGNSTVTVSADFSCWCCSCNSFIIPEDTNIIVILDE